MGGALRMRSGRCLGRFSFLRRRQERAELWQRRSCVSLGEILSPLALTGSHSPVYDIRASEEEEKVVGRSKKNRR